MASAPKTKSRKGSHRLVMPVGDPTPLRSTPS